MKRLLKEPLLHFLLAGAAIFAAYGLLNREGMATDRIVITQGEIASMAEGFTRTWQRPPGPEDLSNLIQDRLRDEVFYREALAIGLDRDDTVVRRRLRQKMEFVSEDVAALAEPTEKQMQDHLLAHPEKFRAAATFTFHHVFLSPNRRGDNVQRDAAQLLEQLQKSGDAGEAGDPFILDSHYRGLPGPEVEKVFGPQFVAGLATVNTGVWAGPLQSGYGLHLVFVAQRGDGRMPGLDEVRNEVKEDWVEAQRVAAREKLFQELLKRYEVIVEPPGVALRDDTPGKAAR